MPVGAPLPVWGVTVAVKLTLWPNTDGLAEENKATVVLALLTAWMISPALAVKLSSPE